MAQSNVDTSGFQVVTPDSLRSDFPEGIAHSDALFGIPAYGGSITGILVYATPAENHTGCHTLTREPQWPSGVPLIVMVDRGDCNFVQKVKNVETLHAVAAVIADNKCQCGHTGCEGVTYPNCDYGLPFMADDGLGGSVNIPSYMISKHDAQALKDCISGVSPLNGCNGQDYVSVKLSWDLPKPDNRVEWTLWTSADDDAGQKFKDEFEKTAIELGSHTLFTPRYFVYDGAAPWRGCTRANHPCGNQCVYGGKYCNPDPDHNFNTGFSGGDIVLENLRRICIWQQANATYETTVGKQWWEYVRLFNKNCWSVDPSALEMCSQAQQRQAELDPAVTTQCILDSNVGTTDNTLLANEVALRNTRSVFITPTVVVNGVVERGGTNQIAVLTTICNGFMEGTAPEVCKCAEASPSAIDDCIEITKNTGVAPVPNYGPVANTGTLVLIIIASAAAAVALSGTVGYVWYRRHHERALRQEVRNILAEYMPLEEAPNGMVGNQDEAETAAMI